MDNSELINKLMEMGYDLELATRIAESKKDKPRKERETSIVSRINQYIDRD